MDSSIGSTTIGKGVASNEMDRLYKALAEQGDLLLTLENRLAPVLDSRVDPGESEKAQEDRPHLSIVAYGVENSNRKLRDLVDRLVI